MKRLAFLLVLFFAVAARADDRPGPIHVSGSPDGAVVEIQGSEAPSFTTSQDGNAFVLDLVGSLGAARAAGTGPVRAVRSEPRGSMTRVVIELEPGAEASPEVQGNRLIVAVHRSPVAPAPALVASADTHAEAERKAAAEARAAAERKAAEDKAAAQARAEAEAAAAEEKATQARAEAERKAAEEKATQARAEAERKSAEEKAAAQARAEAERKAAEEKAAAQARVEAERRAAEEKAAQARLEAERKVAKEKAAAQARADAERKAAEEKAAVVRAEAEAAAAEKRAAQARAESERKAAEERAAQARAEARTAPVPDRSDDGALATAGPPREVSHLGFRPGPDGARVMVKTSAKVRYSLEERPGSVVLVIENARIPLANDRRPLDASFFGTPVGLVRPIEDRRAGVVRIEVALRHPSEVAIEEEQGELFLHFGR